MPRPKRAVEHLLEVGLRRRCGGRRLPASREVQVVQALDELVLRQLVDVLLEREVDRAARRSEMNERFCDRADLLARHPLRAATPRSRDA